jgi:zinc/manganese transport system substrate-binding protein
MGQAAVVLARRLGELDPPNATAYTTRAKDFQQKMESATLIWQQRIDKTGIKEVVTYHKTLNYFFKRFGIANNLQLEPKPGIPPTASHIVDVIDQMKARKIKLVMIENYFDSSVRHKLESEIPGVKVITVPVQVDGIPSAKTNYDLIEQLVKSIEDNSK